MIEKGLVYGRFQILHLKHVEYILAAKMRCKRLYIGIRFMVLQSSRKERAALCRVPVTGRTLVPVTRAMGREGL